jgi:hypothetical protein
MFDGSVYPKNLTQMFECLPVLRYPSYEKLCDQKSLMIHVCHDFELEGEDCVWHSGSDSQWLSPGGSTVGISVSEWLLVLFAALLAWLCASGRVAVWSL